VQAAKRSRPNYALRRVLLLVPIMLAVSVLTFLLGNLAPGDPAQNLLVAQGYEPTADAVQRLRQQLGLAQPLHVRYWHWLLRALRGDLGLSFTSRQPVLVELAQRFPATVQLALTAQALATLITIPLGLAAARYRNSLLDHGARIFALLGASVPNYLMGLLLLYGFGVQLGWLPVVGNGDAKHLVLPAVTLALSLSSTYVRLLRASILDVMGEEFVRVLRAKGLAERTIYLRHALRTALPTLLTAFGLSLGQWLGGSVVVETIFAWPGMGAYAVQSVFTRDYPVVQGYALLMTLVIVLTNLVIDLSYRWADPRIRMGSGIGEA
jgi:peptide/nickel transport system permease protein